MSDDDVSSQLFLAHVIWISIRIYPMSGHAVACDWLADRIRLVTNIDPLKSRAARQFPCNSRTPRLPARRALRHHHHQRQRHAERGGLIAFRRGLEATGCGCDGTDRLAYAGVRQVSSEFAHTQSKSIVRLVPGSETFAAPVPDSAFLHRCDLNAAKQHNRATFSARHGSARPSAPPCRGPEARRP